MERITLTYECIALKLFSNPHEIKSHCTSWVQKGPQAADEVDLIPSAPQGTWLHRTEGGPGRETRKLLTELRLRMSKKTFRTGGTRGGEQTMGKLPWGKGCRAGAQMDQEALRSKDNPPGS